MQTAKTSESFNTYSGTLEVRQHDPTRVSDHYVFHVPRTVDKDSDLPIYFPRNFG
jgi:hypothetical protein